MLYWRSAAVACVIFFAALLIWLYGVRTTVVWAAAMTAFIVILWAATIPLRRRQRRIWLEMGLGPDGRPLPEEEEEADQEAPAGSAGAGADDPETR